MTVNAGEECAGWDTCSRVQAPQPPAGSPSTAPLAADP